MTDEGRSKTPARLTAPADYCTAAYPWRTQTCRSYSKTLREGFPMCRAHARAADPKVGLVRILEIDLGTWTDVRTEATSARPADVPAMYHLLDLWDFTETLHHAQEQARRRRDQDVSA